MSDIIALIEKSVKINFRKGTVFCTSLDIAQVFGKRHDNVIRDIDNLDCSDEFRELNFEESFYNGANSNKSKKYPMYKIMKDGFVFLVMGYSGKLAAFIKEAYIAKFNEMGQALEDRNQLRVDYRPMTDLLQEKYPNDPYVYAREADMLNKIVTGYTARQLKQTRSGSTTRELLASHELESLMGLQRHNTTLLELDMDLDQRKSVLIKIYSKAKGSHFK